MIDLTPDPNASPEDSAMKFPCTVPISAIGLRVDGFAQAVAACVATVVTDFDPKTIEMQPSKTGKYLSVRFSVWALSKTHLIALDTALNNHPQIIRVV